MTFIQLHEYHDFASALAASRVAIELFLFLWYTNCIRDTLEGDKYLRNCLKRGDGQGGKGINLGCEAPTISN
jgi:hypothetical protein